MKGQEADVALAVDNLPKGGPSDSQLFGHRFNGNFLSFEVGTDQVAEALEHALFFGTEDKFATSRTF